MSKAKCFTANAAWVCLLVLSLSTIAFAETQEEMLQPYSLPGIVYDQNTHFQVTESSYLNVSVDTTETVKLTIQSAPETIEMMLEPATTASSTMLTVGGLVPGKAYYKYQDDLHYAEILTADANGMISFVQDLTSRHAIHILTHHSTLFVADDATGGDCSRIGVWTPETKTCQLTTDLTETVQIDSSGITLDGNGHTITGSGSGYGVLVQGSKSNVTIKNLNITNFTNGIQLLEYVSNSTITGNHLYGNASGVEIWWVCYYNVVSDNIIEGNSSWSVHLNRYSYMNRVENNTISGNHSGVAVIHCYSTNYVSNNTIDSNTWHGIQIVWACGTEVNENMISRNYTGIIMTAPGCESWCRTGITRNTISNNSYGLNVGSMGTYWVYQNNFIDNVLQYSVYYSSYGNYTTFYLPLPEGGNYWSNYDTSEEGCSDIDGNGFCDAPLALITSNDEYPRVRPYVPNETPVANASGDQTLLFDPALNGSHVTLDGTGSSDPDGDQLSYTWSWDGGSATGASVAVLLPRGTTTVTLTVNDGRGGTSTDTVNINVRYTFSGFLQPLNLGKPFKTGSTIPVKFQITGAGGAIVTDSVASISTVSLLRAEPTGESIEGTSDMPDSGSLFRYDETSLQYIYNLQTDSFNETMRIIATLDDGTSYTIDIGMK